MKPRRPATPPEQGQQPVHDSLRDPGMWLAVGVFAAMILFFILLIVLNEP